MFEFSQKISTVIDLTEAVWSNAEEVLGILNTRTVAHYLVYADPNLDLCHYRNVHGSFFKCNYTGRPKKDMFSVCYSYLIVLNC